MKRVIISFPGIDLKLSTVNAKVLETKQAAAEHDKPIKGFWKSAFCVENKCLLAKVNDLQCHSRRRKKNLHAFFG